MNPLAQSEALHAKVRQFANWALAGAQDVAQEQARFDELAHEIAGFQSQHCSAVSLLANAQAETTPVAGFDTGLSAVPSDVFRLTRVACHPPELDAARFHTSGTTQKHTGWHCLRTLETYRALSTMFGRRALLGEHGHATVVALMPSLSDTPHSSLATMCGFFMEEFDGRVMPEEDEREAFAKRASRWLVSPTGLDVEGLYRAVTVAHERSEPLIVLATTLSLALLVQTLHNKRIALPSGSVVMQTGGSKGRAHTVDPQALRGQVAELFGIAQPHIIGEYGMTELCSQLYEGALWQPNSAPGVYFAPPWLKVTPVDPITLLPVAEGEVGLARFVDLANVDSALAVLTRDLIRREGKGFHLLGRHPGSPLRGCSLMIEPFLSAAITA